MKIGTGDLVYEVVQGWGTLPDGWVFGDVVGVAVDSRDRVYVFNRGDHPMIVFDRDGGFLESWGEGIFERPHGITTGPGDVMYLTDDNANVVLKCTTSGQVLWTLGTRGVYSDTGYDGSDYRTVKRPGGPFNRPTKVAVSPTGDLFITDGYGNCQVHKFDAEGRYLFSWGTPGDSSGQFRLPHGVCVDRQGRVYVTDRENNRIQVFTPEGDFVTEWTGIRRPNDIFLDKDERLYVASMFALQAPAAGQGKGAAKPPLIALDSYVSVFSLRGDVLARLGEADPCAPGGFYAAHGICADSHGDLYVGEIVFTSGRGPAPAGCHAIQKLARVT